MVFRRLFLSLLWQSAEEVSNEDRTVHQYFLDMISGK